jgi:hypothetical protein
MLFAIELVVNMKKLMETYPQMWMLTTSVPLTQEALTVSPTFELDQQKATDLMEALKEIVKESQLELAKRIVADRQTWDKVTGKTHYC